MTFDDVLERCIEAVEQGENVERCLQRYPDYATQLEPFLRLVTTIKEEPRPMLSQDAFEEGRRQFFVAAHSRQQAERSSQRFWLWSFFYRPQRFIYLAAMILLLLISTVGITQAASDSLPGSPLYVVKRSSERVEGFFAFTPSTQATWHATQSERRLKEAIILRALHRPVPSSLLVEIEQESRFALALSATLPLEERRVLLEQWLHNLELLWQEALEQDEVMRTIHKTLTEVESAIDAITTPTPEILPSQTPTLSASTATPILSIPTATVPPPSLTTTAEPTDFAQPSPTVTLLPSLTPTLPPPVNEEEAEGEDEEVDEEADDEVDEQSSEEIRFEGTVQSIEGNIWWINGQAVLVDNNTRFDKNPTVGTYVEVRAWRFADGTLQADRIKGD